MSNPNPSPSLPSSSCLSSSSSASSKFPSSAFRATPNQDERRLRLQSRSSHFKTRLRASPPPSIFTPSLQSSSSSASSASSLTIRKLSQKFTFSSYYQQRSYSSLLTFFLLSFILHLTDCEPQGGVGGGPESTTTKLQPFSQWSAISSIHQSIVATQNSGHVEEDIHHPPLPSPPDHLPPPQTPTTRPPPSSIIINGNQSSRYASTSLENTASVIASSFRTFDQQQQQQQDDSSNSQEDFSGSPMNSSHQAGGTRRKTGLKTCDYSILKRCLGGLPPMNATGIPSTPQAVNTACRIYDAGITCFDTWAKHCLSEKHRAKVKESITGAHEMYTFLCKDPKFRSDYLKHKVCYRKLSPHWDECSRQFVEGLKRNTKHNYTAFCCIRLEFLTCVNKYSSYSCNREASKFLMKMAETLVRSTIRRRSDTTDYCAFVHPDNCVPIVESSSSGAGTVGAEGIITGVRLGMMVILINSFVLLYNLCPSLVWAQQLSPSSPSSSSWKRK